MSTTAEISAVTNVLLSARARYGSLNIIELGAHLGEDSEWMAALDPQWHIVVEADPVNFAEMSKRLARNCERPPLRLHAAVAPVTAPVSFFPCHNSRGIERASGSTHAPTGHLTHFPWCEFSQPITVPGLSLDDLAARVGRIDLIWCDIQGAERDMIAGGQEALKRTGHLFIEAERVEMYEGQATRDELLALLPDFEIQEEFDYNLLMRRSGV